MATDKQCTKCAEVKPVEMFSKDRGAKDGLFRWCKACSNAHAKAYGAIKRKTEQHKIDHRVAERTQKARARQKAYREANREKVLEATRQWRKNGGCTEQIQTEEKLCRKCRKVKARDEFTVRRDSKDGLDSYCKRCTADRQLIRGMDPAVKAASAAWHKTPKAKETHKKWRASPSGKASVAKYQASEKGKATRARQKTRRRQFEEQLKQNDLTGWDWNRILKANNKACAYCKRPFGPNLKATVDHIIPISKGGQNTKSNVTCACVHCNCSKQDRDRPTTLPAPETADTQVTPALTESD